MIDEAFNSDNIVSLRDVPGACLSRQINDPETDVCNRCGVYCYYREIPYTLFGKYINANRQQLFSIYALVRVIDAVPFTPDAKLALYAQAILRLSEEQSTLSSLLKEKDAEYRKNNRKHNLLRVLVGYKLQQDIKTKLLQAIVNSVGGGS